MIDNSGVDFGFDYDEAETIERLKAFTYVHNLLERRAMQKDLAGVDSRAERSARDVLYKIEIPLQKYSDEKRYNSLPNGVLWTKFFEEMDNDPLIEKYEQFLEAEYRPKVEAIDESQFEVPNQNQKTL